MSSQSISQKSRPLPAWASLALTVALLALGLIVMASLALAQPGSGGSQAPVPGGASGPFGYAPGPVQIGEPTAPEGDNEWTPLGGPVIEGGQANDLAVQPDAAGILYAAVGTPGDGSDTRVYKSSDGAASWTPVYTSAAYRLYAVAVTGTLVYVAGQGDYGSDIIVKSDDAGASWTPVFTGLQDYQNEFRALAINPQAPSTVYAVAGDWWHLGQMAVAGVYRTDDGGLTWTPVLTSPEGCCGSYFLAVAINPATPTTVYAAGWNSGSTGYGVIYRSDDDGLTWTEVYTAGPSEGSPQFTSLLVNPTTPNIVYAGSGWGPNHVYRSTDSGDTWTRVLTDAAGFELAFDAPGTLYAAADWGGVFRSTSGGDPGSWEYMGNTPDGIGSLALDGASAPTILYAGHYNQGVSSSADGGSTWELRNNGIETAVRPMDIDLDPQDVDKMFAAAECGGGWMTTDGGQTWTEPSGVAGCMGAFAINPGDPDIVYGGGFDCSRGAVLRSDNGGLDFEPVYTATFIITDCSGGDEGILDLAIAPSMTSTVYAAGRDQPNWAGQQAVVVRSLDDGASWTVVFTLPEWSHIETVAINPTDDGIVYAGGETCGEQGCSGFLYRSIDGGDTWQPALVVSNTVSSIVVDYQKPNVLYAATRGPYDVYKSTDGGDTWTLIRSNNPPFQQPSGYLLAIDPHVPSHVYLGGWGYIAETPDGGLTWSDDPINQGTPVMEPGALTVDNGTVTQTLYAGFSGVWIHDRAAPQPGEPMTIDMYTDPPTSLQYANGLNGVSYFAYPLDEYDNWVANGTPVTITYEWNFGGEPGQWEIVKNTNNGYVKGGLFGIAAPGMITFTARANVTATAMVTMAFIYNPPAGITVVAEPDSIATGGATAVVTATVPGLHDGTASDGTEVTFETSLGTIDDVAYTQRGVATATLTSGSAAGTATITARTDGFEATTSVQFTGNRIYLPIVLRNGTP